MSTNNFYTEQIIASESGILSPSYTRITVKLQLNNPYSKALLLAPREHPKDSQLVQTQCRYLTNGIHHASFTRVGLHWNDILKTMEGDNSNT